MFFEKQYYKQLNKIFMIALKVKNSQGEMKRNINILKINLS